MKPGPGKSPGHHRGYPRRSNRQPKHYPTPPAPFGPLPKEPAVFVHPRSIRVFRCRMGFHSGTAVPNLHTQTTGGSERSRDSCLEPDLSPSPPDSQRSQALPTTGRPARASHCRPCFPAHAKALTLKEIMEILVLGVLACNLLPSGRRFCTRPGAQCHARSAEEPGLQPAFASGFTREIHLARELLTYGCDETREGLKEQNG